MCVKRCFVLQKDCSIYDDGVGATNARLDDTQAGHERMSLEGLLVITEILFSPCEK